MTTQFWIQIIAYAVSFGAIYGMVTTRLKALEKKVDCHNKVVERTYKVESDIRLIKSDIKNIEEGRYAHE